MTAHDDITIEQAMEVLFAAPRGLGAPPPEGLTCHSQEFIPGSLPLKDDASRDYIRGVLDALWWFVANIDKYLRSESFATDTERRRLLGFIKRHVVQREIRAFDQKRKQAGYSMDEIWPDAAAELGAKAWQYEKRLKPGTVLDPRTTPSTVTEPEV